MRLSDVAESVNRHSDEVKKKKLFFFHLYFSEGFLHLAAVTDSADRNKVTND